MHKTFKMPDLCEMLLGKLDTLLDFSSLCEMTLQETTFNWFTMCWGCGCQTFFHHCSSFKILSSWNLVII